MMWSAFVWGFTAAGFTRLAWHAWNFAGSMPEESTEALRGIAARKNRHE